MNKEDMQRDMRRAVLYFYGLADREIADLEGVKKCTIKSWRKLRNLPPNMTRQVIEWGHLLDNSHHLTDM